MLKREGVHKEGGKLGVAVPHLTPSFGGSKFLLWVVTRRRRCRTRRGTKRPVSAAGSLPATVRRMQHSRRHFRRRRRTSCGSGRSRRPNQCFRSVTMAMMTVLVVMLGARKGRASGIGP